MSYWLTFFLILNFFDQGLVLVLITGVDTIWLALSLPDLSLILLWFFDDAETSGFIKPSGIFILAYLNSALCGWVMVVGSPLLWMGSD